MSLREAAQQALEALEDAVDHLPKPNSTECGHAITALRTALAESRDSTKTVVESEQRTEPMQEPVACECHRCIEEKDLRAPGTGFPLSMTKMILCPNCGNKRCPKASDHRLACAGSNEPGQPGSIYPAHPAPQRKPLSDEEIVDIWADVSMDYDDQINIIEMARAIERAHGIGGEA